jgi:hypothetical protein
MFSIFERRGGGGAGGGGAPGGWSAGASGAGAGRPCGGAQAAADVLLTSRGNAADGAADDAAPSELLAPVLDVGTDIWHLLAL